MNKWGRKGNTTTKDRNKKFKWMRETKTKGEVKQTGMKHIVQRKTSRNKTFDTVSYINLIVTNLTTLRSSWVTPGLIKHIPQIHFWWDHLPNAYM